ncbi:ABC-type multidrug transport system fused ATPase/permease subunit [Humibacillus xanthopallidus]|uniref:ABC-type multidrug transport system fused ATPase/permease subunit n=2 Tax=Humibacillus xanthopallidus TaxID=412689 RepID=A0A543PXK4_9MICO|nr:ABC-type multidrug transport system fused ATPase/permease subunit [Humibacillus xanthopallidus]
MALLAAVSFFGALLEAFFLVTVTGVAMALVGERPAVGPILGQTVALGHALLIAAIVLIVRLILNMAGVRTSADLAANVTTDQRFVLSHAYLETDWPTQQAEPAGRLQELLTTFVLRVNNTVVTLTQAVTALLSLLAFLGAGLLVDPGSTLGVLVALTLVGAILAPLRQRIRRHAAASAGAGVNFANAVSELGSFGLEMHTFGVERQISDRIDELTHQATGTQRRVLILTQSLPPVYISLAYAAVLGGVGVLTLVGVDSLTVIGTVMLLMLRSLSYGQQLATASGSLAANAPFIDQIRTTVERYESHAAGAGHRIPGAVTPLEALEVEFAYTPERVTLFTATFQIQPGEVVGVIGPSGAGKSTVAQLLLGLRQPTRGKVRVDGVDLRDVDKRWWSSRVAFVPQEARLLTGTVAENVRFFRNGIDDLMIVDALTQANILQDVEALPSSFNTHLGQLGAHLSGGQRQRLSIARALAGKPELLVLDEPTSALDGASESLIRDTLEALKGQVAVVIIAHRMSTLDMCDRIMVLEAGRITAFDSPANLHRDSAFYRNALAVAGISMTSKD